MKKFLLAFSALLVTTLLFTACSKDKDPADSDLFVGTYDGKITYVAGDENKSADNGKVTVVKVGNNYNFVFSDGIPDLKGVQFKKDGDNAVISIDEDEAKYIRITASQLTIAYTNGDAVWTANGTR